jgi:peptidoglycan/xylan/chitin deacetylase (PgdA/CDA1 family)
MHTLARRATRWFRSRSDGPAVVLLYHRVAMLESDPWSLAVSPHHFAEHLQVLRAHADALSVRETVRRAREGTLPRRAVALTFDDGYRDNLLHAQPLLQQYGVPATVFVPTAALTTGREFWWDELESLLLQPGVLPAQIRLAAGGREHCWELAETSTYEPGQLARLGGWRAWEAPPGKRQEVYRAIWELLHPLDEAARERVLEQLRSAADALPADRPTHRVLSPGELVELVGDGSIDVGAHTVTHPSLAALPPARQEWEIRRGREQLEEIIGRPVTTFAYPFGKPHDYTQATAAILRQSGFHCAFTNVPGAVDRAADPYQLPRIYVTDMDGDGFARLLAEWLPLRGVKKRGAR